MLNEQEKTKAEERVRIIMKAAKIFTVDPCGEDALQRLELTA